MDMSSCLSIMLFNVDVVILCVCVNYCVLVVIVYDCMLLCMSYVFVFML